MLKTIKKSSLGLSLVAMLALTPLSVFAASAGGVFEGTSESTSALIEDPSFEAQLIRINVGVNLVRINTDILESMPVSQDSKWVDEVIALVTSKKRQEVFNMDEVKNDAYYSTAALTNAILGRRAMVMSPLTVRLYLQASVIYKNSTNGNSKNKIPDMNTFPDITDTKTYVSFKADDSVALIDVEASTGNLFPNVEAAVISLLPEDLQEGVTSAKDDYDVAKENVGTSKSEVASIEAWLDDDANIDSDEKAGKSAELEAAEVALTENETVMDEKENIYFELLASGAEAIENNFDDSKIPLAKKLDSLLDAVDNNAFGAVSMFTSATAGLTRGMGMLDKELKAILLAQGLTNLVGNQKQYIAERYTRMMIGSLLALPNITLGSYYAVSQSSKIGKYQDIVAAVLAGDKAGQ